MQGVEISASTEADVEATTRCAAAAFAADPLMHFFFGEAPMGLRAATVEFFTRLMRARLALGMPALVARRESAIVGVAMGYDAAPPEWPEAHARGWEGFDAYEQVAERYRPLEPHYYLGVLGVDPALKGKGLGRELLQAFCERSAADSGSSGVYLETGSEASLAFYLSNGYVLQGEADLGGTRLWCVFAPHRAKDNSPGSRRSPQSVRASAAARPTGIVQPHPSSP